MIDLPIANLLPTGRFRGAAKWEIRIYSQPSEPNYLVVSYDLLDNQFKDPSYFKDMLDAISCATRRMQKTLSVPMAFVDKPSPLFFLRHREMSFDKTDRRLWNSFFGQEFTTGDMIAYLESSVGMRHQRALMKSLTLLDRLIDAGMVERRNQ